MLIIIYKGEQKNNEKAPTLCQAIFCSPPSPWFARPFQLARHVREPPSNFPNTFITRGYGIPRKTKGPLRGDLMIVEQDYSSAFSSTILFPPRECPILDEMLRPRFIFGSGEKGANENNDGGPKDRRIFPSISSRPSRKFFFPPSRCSPSYTNLETLKLVVKGQQGNARRTAASGTAGSLNSQTKTLKRNPSGHIRITFNCTVSCALSPLIVSLRDQTTLRYPYPLFNIFLFSDAFRRLGPLSAALQYSLARRLVKIPFILQARSDGTARNEKVFRPRACMRARSRIPRSAGFSNVFYGLDRGTD